MRVLEDVKRLIDAPSAYGVLSLIFGLICYGTAKSPDVPQGLLPILGAFFLFLSFILAQYSWGSLLAEKFIPHAKIWETLFFGSLFFALLPAVFGYLPILGESSRVYWLLFFLLGFILNSRKRISKILINNFYVIDAIVGIPILLALLGSFNVHGFWDSLWYHLTTSRVWFEAGSIQMPDYFPISMKTGLWDYHFLYGQLLLGTKGGGGLISAQLFGQWLSLSFVAYSYLLLREESSAFGLSPFSCALAILGTELFMMAEFAKNDWGSVFWGLSFLAFMAHKKNSSLIAAAAAACFTAKFTSAFFLLPFLLLLFWEYRAISKQISFVALFFFFALPIFWRNFYFTKNPFFPTFPNQFPNLMGPSWQGISDYEGVTWGFKQLFGKLYFLFRDSWIIFGLLVFPFVQDEFSKKQKIVLSASACALLLFFFFSGPKAEWRLAGAALILLAAYGARSLELVLKLKKAPSLFLSAVLCGTLLLLPIDWQAPGRLLKGTELSEQARSWVSASAIAWTRMNLPLEAKIATLNEQRTYYLFPHLPLRIFDIPELDKTLSQTTNAKEAKQAIQQYGIRYLVLSAEFLDSYYNRKICDWFYQASEKYPQAVLYKTEYSRVLDLSLVP